MSMKVIEAIAIAAEMTGTELSKAAIRGMELELEAYPEADVLAALARCRRELKHRLTLADIIERLNKGDGRPGADEAWAKALLGMDEDATVVLSDEISEAMAAARPIFNAGDEVGARMAFRSAYERVVQANREAKIPVRWWVSLGCDPNKREAAVQEGIRQGLLANETARLVLPPPEASKPNPEIAAKLKALALSLGSKSKE